jgi:hypothetical protein
MEKKMIYLVSSGYYSDYGINAVFSQKILAKKYIDLTGDKGFNIEEYELNPNEIHIVQGRSLYFLQINKNGDVKGIEKWAGFSYSMKQPKLFYGYDINWLNVYCYANDEMQAVKIAGEKRTQVLANNCWGDEEKTINLQ